MNMITTIIKIGNSKGIRIPSAILKKHGIKENDKLVIKETMTGFSLSFDNARSRKKSFSGIFNDLPKPSKDSFLTNPGKTSDETMEAIRKMRVSRKIPYEL